MKEHKGVAFCNTLMFNYCISISIICQINNIMCQIVIVFPKVHFRLHTEDKWRGINCQYKEPDQVQATSNLKAQK